MTQQPQPGGSGSPSPPPHGLFGYDESGRLQSPLTPQHKLYTRDTGILGLSCQIVEFGVEASQSSLERVSIVNEFGFCLYDKFVQLPKGKLSFRSLLYMDDEDGTKDLRNRTSYGILVKEVEELLHGHIVVGHLLKRDLSMLGISHPMKRQRSLSLHFGEDAQVYKLAKDLLGIDIPWLCDSLQKAQTVMEIYRCCSGAWEVSVREATGADVLQETLYAFKQSDLEETAPLEGEQQFVNVDEVQLQSSQQSYAASAKTTRAKEDDLKCRSSSKVIISRITPGPSSSSSSLSPRGKNLFVFGYFRYNHHGQLLTKVTPSQKKLTTDTGILSIDCKLVGVGPEKTSHVGRVSIVNIHGFCLYDKFVKPKKGTAITEYRTPISGIRKKDMKRATGFSNVVQEVRKLLKNHILVGHDLTRHLGALGISHPPDKTRDTSVYYKAHLKKSQTQGLKMLSNLYLFTDIHEDGDHSSITDAQAAMGLYLLKQQEWDAVLRTQPQQLQNTKVGANPLGYFDYDRVGLLLTPLAPAHHQLIVATNALCVAFKMVIVQREGTEKCHRVVGWVAVVNEYGFCVYNKFVVPREPLVSCKSKKSGIKKMDLKRGTPYNIVGQELDVLLKDHIVVGHSLGKLAMLGISRPEETTREIAMYASRKLKQASYSGLKTLVEEVFKGGVNYKDERSAVQDAQLLMAIYQRYRKRWEKAIRYGGKKNKCQN